MEKSELWDACQGEQHAGVEQAQVIEICHTQHIWKGRVIGGFAVRMETQDLVFGLLFSVLLWSGIFSLGSLSSHFEWEQIFYVIVCQKYGTWFFIFILPGVTFYSLRNCLESQQRFWMLVF